MTALSLAVVLALFGGPGRAPAAVAKATRTTRPTRTTKATKSAAKAKPVVKAKSRTRAAATTKATNTTTTATTTTTTITATTATTATTTTTTTTTAPTAAVPNPGTTVIPRLPTGPGAPPPAEALVLLPPVPPGVGTTIAHRTIDPLGNLPADLSPQEYVDAVLGWVEALSVRRRAVDLPALRARVEAVTASATATSQTYPALAAYLSLLGDGHSALYPPNEARSLLEGRARGFGFSLIDGIIFPLPSSPADQAGLRDRDRLLRVNGTTYVKGTRLSTIPDISTFDVARVEPATDVESTVSVTVTRGEIATSLRPKIRRLTTPGGADTRLGLIDLPGATGSRADETSFVAAGLEGLRDADSVARCGWVLDLRRNSGGFGTTMLAGVAPLYGDGIFAGLLDSGERVSWLSIRGTSVLQDGQVQISGAFPLKLANPAAPIAVLTGPVTASAAELAVIGLAGRPGVRVFGEPTVGVTSGNLGRSYPDGSFVAVTSVYDVDRLGRVYDGPLRPDEAVAMDWRQLGLATDPVLTAATTWLTGQPACSVGG